MENTQLIEQTSKPLKKQILIAAAVMLAGIGIIFLGINAERIAVSLGGGVVALGGIVWMAVTKCRIWWNHK